MDREISFILSDIASQQFEFSTFNSLRSFINDEFKYWAPLKDKYPAEGLVSIYIHASVNSLEGVKTSLDSLKSQLKGLDQATLQSQIDSTITKTPSNWLSKNHPYINPWLNIYDKYDSATADAFIHQCINKTLHNPSTLEGMRGLILAYEFELQNESTLTKRRDSERNSISKVRSDLVKGKDQLFKEVSKFQDDFQEWDSETRNNSERLYRANKYIAEKKGKRFDKELDEHLETWTEKIINLQKTYQDLLRLKEPAEYWKNRAEKLREQAGIFLFALIVISQP